MMPIPPKKIVSESLTMMVTAFGLVAALAWNEAVKALINEFVPRASGVLSLFIYAILVTILAVVIGTRLGRIKQRLEDEVK